MQHNVITKQWHALGGGTLGLLIFPVMRAERMESTFLMEFP